MMKSEDMVNLHRGVRRVMLLLGVLVLMGAHTKHRSSKHDDGIVPRVIGVTSVHSAMVHDVSAPLISLAHARQGNELNLHRSRLGGLDNDFAAALGASAAKPDAPIRQKNVTPPLISASVEQTEQGTRPAPEIVASIDGLGEGFDGPQGTAMFRNPSDNSLAVGPDHIVQIVNSRMAIFTKKGSRFDTTGRVLYGPVPTNNVFNGDAVVRYDQLADRWLIVMPIFRRLPSRKSEPLVANSGKPTYQSQAAVEKQPGAARPVFRPPHPTPEQEAAARAAMAQMLERFRQGGRRRFPRSDTGSYAMCYAVSASPDPLGSYYRYEFVRPLFPDYPRPAVWPDGYYRWMASPAIDGNGNIGIGYSFGGTPYYPGQRFAGRLSNDPLGILTLHEVVLVEGKAAQTNTLRWMDYAQTAIDPSDDRTIWYVGDYLKEGAANYSTRIGAFRLTGSQGTK